MKMDVEAGAAVIVEFAITAGDGGCDAYHKKTQAAIKEAMGIKRLTTKRLEEIVTLASQRKDCERRGKKLFYSPSPSPKKGVGGQSGTDSAFQRAIEESKKSYMGLMQQAKLNDRSRGLPDHQRAADLFTNCPCCGTAITVAAAVSVE